jgi:AraC family transcriptional activator FtrA
MPSNRKTPTKRRNPWKVAALIYDGLSMFEFSIVGEVFGLPRPELKPWYQFSIAALETGRLRSNSGITVNADGGLGILDHAGTILLPGWRDTDEKPPEILLRKLRRAHQEGARIGSICNAAFLLAETGLLDGLQATTHWRCAAALAQRYPKVEVAPDVLYIDCGQVLTSAGSAAGIDLCLHIVRRDCGVAIANTVARRLVVPPHRSGGQKQFIETPIEEAPEKSIAEALDTIRTRLNEPHTVSSMAVLAGLSQRTFARRFSQMNGTSPYVWLMNERIRKAQALLETSDLSIDHIAEACGFSDTQTLRLRFKQLIGTPPSVYRKTFHH